MPIYPSNIFLYCNIIFLLLVVQTKMTASEAEMDSEINQLYLAIENTTMPTGLQQRLLDKVSATNQSLQILFGVRCLVILLVSQGL